MTDTTLKLCIDCEHCSGPFVESMRDNKNFYDCKRVTDVVTGAREAAPCSRERDYPAIGVPGYCGREGKYWTPRQPTVKP